MLPSILWMVHWCNPRPVTLTAQNQSWDYDGHAHTWPQYDITSGSLVTGHTLVVTVTGTITDVGTKPNVITDYHFTAGDIANYAITTADGTLEITEGAVVPLTITANSNSWEYDGTAHSDNGYTLNINGGSDIAVTGSNYTFENGDVLTVTISGSVTNVSESPVTNTITNVKVMRGTTDMTAHYETSDRHNGELTITKRPVTVNVTGHTLASVYDGTEKSVSGYDLICSDALFNTGTVTYTGTSSLSSTNVCDQAMSLAAANFATSNTNFNPTFTIVSDGHLTITKRQVTVTADDQAFEYDGQVHNATATFTPSNFANAADEAHVSITVSGSIQYPTQSPVTKQIESVVFDNATVGNNYEVTRVNGKLTMDYGTPIDLTITSLGDTWTYDGTAHSKNGFTYRKNSTDYNSLSNSIEINGSHGDIITITLGTQVTDVTAGTPNTIASYTIKNGTVDVRSKYHVLLGTNNLVVNPKAATITAKSHTWDYDGYAHSDNGYTVTGMVGSDTLTATIEGTITAPGTVANRVTAYSMTIGQASNYSFTLNDGELKVNNRTDADRIPLIITANSDTKMYDGTALTADGYDLLYDSQHYTVGSNGTYDFINGDRLYVDIQGSNTDNFDVTFQIVSDGQLTITPITDAITVTITGNNLTRIYDGNAHTVTGYTFTSTNALYDQSKFTNLMSTSVSDNGYYPASDYHYRRF